MRTRRRYAVAIDENIPRDEAAVEMNAAESKGSSFINRKDRLVEEAKTR